jgi:dienelactone hydrolase
MKKALTLLFAITFYGVVAQNLNVHNYQDGEQALQAMVTSNTKQNKPCVLILPAWKGIDEEAKTAAQDLEKLGYMAFIADIYGVGNTPTDNSSAAKIAGQYKKDYLAYQHRIAVALQECIKLGADPNKIAVIGYCFGGTGALETARAGLTVQGVVCIHGGLSRAPEREIAPIKTKVLVEHPAADRSVSKEDYDNLLTELNTAQADWQIVTYANCGHTFTNPLSKDYNELMAKRAWSHTTMFLKEVLQ